jgi:hypothetical protein
VKRLVLAMLLAVGFACAATSNVHADIDENGELIVVEEKPDPLKNMKLIAAYALTAIGAVVVGMAVMKTFASNMSYPQTRMTLVNFLRTNPYQVLIIGKTMAGTVVEPVAEALKAGGQVGTQDPKIIATATIPTYDAFGKAVISKWGATMMKAKLGFTAGLAGLVMGVMTGSIIPIILGSLCILGFVRLFMFKQELESNILRGRAEILPEVDKAIETQRYYVPPPVQQ